MTTLAATDLPSLAATAAPTGLFVLDARGDASYVNPRLAALLGAPADALLGGGLVARLLGETSVGDPHRIALAFDLAGTGESTHATMAPRATLRVLIARSTDGAGLVGAVEDVTCARDAAERARQLDLARERSRRLEALGVLAGGVAHDFNNLLVGIVGNATLAELDIDPDGDAASALGDLRLSCERATDFTAQLLAVGGRGATAAQSVDAAATVEEALAAPGFAAARSRIVRECAATLPRVLYDPARLRQVVTHLVTNAVEATVEQDGRVTVRTGVALVDAARISALMFDGGLAPGAHVCIEVEDNGVGMTAAALDRAFEPFVTTKVKRRGLGLALVAGTARTYRAGIEAVSAVGAGTSIRLLLALDPAERAAPVPSAAPPAVRAQGSILVVDDETAVRDVTRRLLSRQGFDVLEASSGEEAMQVLSAEPSRVRFVLLDHSMPGMDGTETFRRMRELVPDLRVVMTSGYSERDLRARVGSDALAGYLQKPFDLAALVRMARAAVAA